MLRSFWGIALVAGFSLMVSFNAAGAPPPKGSFDKVGGFGNVPVVASVDQVQKALTKARIPFSFKVFHKTGTVYLVFATPGLQTSRAGGPWEATVYFDHEERLTQLLLKGPLHKKEAPARAFVKQLVERYGTPGKATPEGTGSRYWTELWKNDRVQLKVSLTSSKREDEWQVWQAWSPVGGPQPPRKSSSKPLSW